MKIELGGGDRNRGDDWVNLDTCPTADIHHDLNKFPMPFEDNAIDEVYSSHCLEHVIDPIRVLNEISRITKLGSHVEIRVPHFGSEMAMVAGHIGIVPEQMLINMDYHFVKENWTGKYRLKLDRTEYGAAAGLANAKRDLPFLAGLDDITIMKWIQGTCHELRFHFTVIENEAYAK